jgi:hypothetical protein
MVENIVDDSYGGLDGVSVVRYMNGGEKGEGREKGWRKDEKERRRK